MNVTNTPLIKAENLTYAKDDDPILENLSFVINEGDYLGITGPNGSGKTTLLKMFLGLLTPTSGTISLLGTDPVTSPYKSSIGYVPQRLSHSDHAFPATVSEIVMTGIIAQKKGLNMFSAKDKELAREAMNKANIYELKNKLIHNLSGGQKQRVFIARALASRPKLLILDEPTSGVDVGSQKTFYELLKQLNNTDSLTIILVSHDMEVISREVKSVMYLNKTIQYLGDPQNFFKHSHLDMHTEGEHTNA